ncbi:MAG: 30S ribosomal protein S2 [Acidobacteriota bacterium]
MPSVSIKELLQAGVHFGHQTKKWNPKIKQYLFGQRNGIYIIDLQKTLKKLKEACEFVASLGREGRTILFVGTKRQAQEAIREEAARSGNFYVNQRWLGGLITNWETVKTSVNTLKSIEELLQQQNGHDLSKKELSRIDKKRAKLSKVFDGIKDMHRPPDALFVIDPKRERIAVSEANRRSIKVVAVVDTNCDPTKIDYVIPGNDDAIRAIRLFTSCVADSYLEGSRVYEEKRAAHAAEAEKTDQETSGREPSEKVGEIAAQAPRKRITLTVPPGGQAPKPSGPSQSAPAHADGSAKAN